MALACSAFGGESPDQEVPPYGHQEACEALDDARAKRVAKCTNDLDSGVIYADVSESLDNCRYLVLWTPSSDPVYKSCLRKLESQKCASFEWDSNWDFDRECSTAFIQRSGEWWAEKENAKCVDFTSAMSDRLEECAQQLDLHPDDLQMALPPAQVEGTEIFGGWDDCRAILKKGPTYDTCLAQIPRIECTAFLSGSERLPAICHDLRFRNLPLD